MLFYHLDCFLAFAKVSGQIHAFEFTSEIILKVKCFTVPCFTECSIFRNILYFLLSCHCHLILRQQTDQIM